MKRSSNGILATHMGSLPQPQDVYDMIQAKEKGQSYDREKLATRVREAVVDIVKKQSAAGVTVPNDGEQGKSNWTAYVKDRLNGLSGEGIARPMPNNDQKMFPQYFSRNPNVGRALRPTANGPLSWKDFSAAETDVANLKHATQVTKVEDAFMSASSPGNVSNFHPNRYYKSEDEYLKAIGDVMNREYKAITDAGFILQLDCPDLAIKDQYFPATTTAEFRTIIAQRVDALNYATRNIPAEQVRVHICWGRGETARMHELPLKDMVDIFLKARPQGLTIVHANGKHEYEWKVWRDHKLSDGKVLIPGVIDNTAGIIEHPETVAERIGRYASVVGRENVIAGVNCGFGNQPEGSATVHTEIAWAKLKALGDGAQLATKELWKK